MWSRWRLPDWSTDLLESDLILPGQMASVSIRRERIVQIAMYSGSKADQADMNERIQVVRDEDDAGEAMRIAIELGISVFIDYQSGHTGTFFINEDGSRGPMRKENFGHHGSSTKATLEAICCTANLLVNGAGTEAYPWK